jgi:hypothetical protein
MNQKIKLITEFDLAHNLKFFEWRESSYLFENIHFAAHFAAPWTLPPEAVAIITPFPRYIPHHNNYYIFKSVSSNGILQPILCTYLLFLLLRLNVTSLLFVLVEDQDCVIFTFISCLNKFCGSFYCAKPKLSPSQVRSQTLPSSVLQDIRVHGWVL